MSVWTRRRSHPPRQVRLSLAIALFVIASALHGQQSTADLNRSQLAAATQLARAGNYLEASKELSDYLNRVPTNAGARCLLAIVYIRDGNKDDALSQLKILTAEPPSTTTTSCIAQLTPALRPELNKPLEKEFDLRLYELKGDAALAIVDKLTLETHQKELLKFYVTRKEGKLVEAVNHLKLIKSAEPNASISDLEHDLVSDLTLLSEIKARVEWYRYSALTNGSCTPDFVRRELPRRNFSMQEFVRVVANGEKEFPLDSWVLDQAFFATLLSKPYEDLESFGDKILAAKGSLRIPFYSKNALFDLVIDTRERRLRTDLDAKVPTNEAGTDRMLDLDPFDVSFSGISSLSQKTSSDVDTGALGKKSFVLQLAPQGLAPSFAFMDAVHCLYGEAVQKTITANLGRFIAHVLGMPQSSVHLVNPDKKTRDWLLIADNSITMGLFASSQIANVRADNQMNGQQLAALKQESMQILSDNNAQAARLSGITTAQSEEAQTWHDQTIRIMFSEIEADQVRRLQQFELALLALMDQPSSK